MVELRNQLAGRVREVRQQQGVTQEDAAQALGMSQPTYCRIENGTRALKGDELVILADLFGVRAAAITGIAAVRERARFAAHTGGTDSSMEQMRERLYAYLELDSYLTDQGVPVCPHSYSVCSISAWRRRCAGYEFSK